MNKIDKSINSCYKHFDKISFYYPKYSSDRYASELFIATNIVVNFCLFFIVGFFPYITLSIYSIGVIIWFICSSRVILEKECNRNSIIFSCLIWYIFLFELLFCLLWNCGKLLMSGITSLHSLIAPKPIDPKQLENIKQHLSEVRLPPFEGGYRTSPATCSECGKLK